MIILISCNIVFFNNPYLFIILHIITQYYYYNIKSLIYLANRKSFIDHIRHDNGKFFHI